MVASQGFGFSHFGHLAWIAVAGMVLAGCGSNTAPPAPSAAPVPLSATGGAGDTVGWMNGFCGVAKGFLADTNSMKTPDSGGTVESVQKATSQQLGDYAAILGKAVDALNALPPSPVPAAETAKQDYLGKYTSARDKAANAKAELDKASKNSTAAQEKAVNALIAAQTDAHGAIDPVGEVIGSPELKLAAATAPRCQAGT